MARESVVPAAGAHLRNVFGRNPWFDQENMEGLDVMKLFQKLTAKTREATRRLIQPVAVGRAAGRSRFTLETVDRRHSTRPGLAAKLVFLLGFMAVEMNAADRTSIRLERRFAETVHPFLE